MQAVALVTGDEFLVPYNLTIDADDVALYISNLTTDPRRFLWNVNFDDRYGTALAVVYAPSGICFNFNLVESHDLFNLELLPSIFNYTKSIAILQEIYKYRARSAEPNKPYPMKVSDFRSGMFALIHQVVKYLAPFDLNHYEKYTSQGAKFWIHNPYEMISQHAQMHRSITNHSLVVYLSPQKMIIDKALELYPPERRGCYLKDEKPLKFFKFYTKNNCKSECLANKTVSVCGCAQFFMVRDISTRTCGVSDMKCYKRVEEEWLNKDWCECILECGEVEYKTEVQQNEFVEQVFFKNFI
jgi:acid-sensing ion channel, other